MMRLFQRVIGRKTQQPPQHTEPAGLQEVEENQATLEQEKEEPVRQSKRYTCHNCGHNTCAAALTAEDYEDPSTPCDGSEYMSSPVSSYGSPGSTTSSIFSTNSSSSSLRDSETREFSSSEYAADLERDFLGEQGGASSDDHAQGSAMGAGPLHVNTKQSTNYVRYKTDTMCACGEWGCTCRCSPGCGPSPRELRFFPLNVDPYLDTAGGGSDKPKEDPRFCSPECQWSFRARQEFQIGQRVTLESRRRKLQKQQEEQKFQQQLQQQLQDKLQKEFDRQQGLDDECNEALDSDSCESCDSESCGSYDSYESP